MSVSYQFSDHHNFQSLLWDAAGAIGRTVHTARQLPTMGLAACLWLYALLMALWPDVACLMASSAKVAGVALAIGGVVAVIAALPVELFVGLAVVGVYAVVTMPKGGK